MSGRSERMGRTLRTPWGTRRWACWLLLAGVVLLPGCQFLQNEMFSLDRAAPGLGAQRRALEEVARG